MNGDVQHFVLHDFRPTASTHLYEMEQSSDAIEKALAHSIKGIEGVYNRDEYAEERRKILQLWANFVETKIDQGRKVVLDEATGKLQHGEIGVFSFFPSDRHSPGLNNR